MHLNQILRAAVLALLLFPPLTVCADSGPPLPPPYPDALINLIHQSRENRRSLLEARARLVQSLQTVSIGERAAIIDAFRAEHRAAIAVERELRRNMRGALEEIRRARRNASGSAMTGGAS